MRANAAISVRITTVLLAGISAYGQPVPSPRPVIYPNPYPAVAPDDPVGRLAKKIEAGEVKLEYQGNKWGYLQAVLQHLSVGADSQVLMFAKNSFQFPKISPQEPRALYFNDSVAVGYVQGGDELEFAAVDPRQGVIFYTLDVRPAGKPKFERQTICLQCHQGEGNLFVPGLTVKSVFAGPDGTPAVGVGDVNTDHRTPFEDRWGGWYVTGSHGLAVHRGNAVAPDPARPADLDSSSAMNLVRLDKLFDTSAYLVPSSDIVALMTLEHQARMTNMITRIGRQTLAALRGKELDGAESASLDAAIEEIIAYMLFADEAPLHEPVAGVSTFTKTFPDRGPRDKQGRSLRDFDLQTRLFRYPLSYMIYSEAFDAIPAAARERIYKRLYEVLTSENGSAKLARLTAADRLAVFEILRDTKPDLPAYWR